MTKKFHLKADITFEAKDLDDAFVKLAGHFGVGLENLDNSPMQFIGEMDLKAVESPAHRAAYEQREEKPD